MKILAYKNDGTTATLKNKTLQQVDGNLYYFTEIDEYNNATYFYYIKLNSDICYPLARTRHEFTARDIEDFKDYNEQNILQHLKNCEQKGRFISNIDIYLCELLGLEELAKHYRKYRELYIKLQEQERKEEQKRQKLEQEQQEKEKQKEIEKLEIAKAQFLNGKEITAEQFEKLCNNYNIKIPIKVLGWMREHCSYISAKKWDNEQLLKQYGHIPNFVNKYDVKYYYTKGHNSTTFSTIIDKLATAMNL